MFVRNVNAAKAHINRITCLGRCYYKISPSIAYDDDEEFEEGQGKDGMGYLSYFRP